MDVEGRGAPAAPLAADWGRMEARAEREGAARVCWDILVWVVDDGWDAWFFEE